MTTDSLSIEPLLAGSPSIRPIAPRYSIGTWSSEKQAYTPQRGLSVLSFNIHRAQLRQALHELRAMLYSAHRKRDSSGSYDDNDTFVLVERTDGMHWKDIMRSWRRY